MPSLKPSNRRSVLTNPPGPLARSSSGMTLIEVLAVVVILGLLAATLAVGFSGALGKGKAEIAKTGIGILTERVNAYHLIESAWPDSLEALTTGRATPQDAFFLPESSLVDPWGHRYVLIVPGPEGHPFEIVSYGADAAEGGTGENADLSSAFLRSDR